MLSVSPDTEKEKPMKQTRTITIPVSASGSLNWKDIYNKQVQPRIISSTMKLSTVVDHIGVLFGVPIDKIGFADVTPEEWDTKRIRDLQ
jgi:hypothetical protein